MMNTVWDVVADVPRGNLVAAWAGVVLGFVSGFLLGLGFHDERFLGGYADRRRRLYRLGHISFFGLALINFMFWLTVRLEGLVGGWVGSASMALLLGAATMPVCCVLMAHWIRARFLFAVPVVSLLYGAVVILARLAAPGSAL